MKGKFDAYILSLYFRNITAQYIYCTRALGLDISQLNMLVPFIIKSNSCSLYLSISEVHILKKYSHFILLSTIVKINKREKCWLAEHFCVSTHAIVLSYASYFYESYCMRFYNDVKLSTEVERPSLISFYSFWIHNFLVFHKAFGYKKIHMK